MQVHFHPAQPNLMLSASLDGLVNVFDFSEGIDEDNAFKVRSFMQRVLVLCGMPVGFGASGI